MPNLPKIKRAENKPKGTTSSANSSSAVAISIVGVFVIGFIFLLAKGLFTSNSKEVPSGIDTATINTDITEKNDDESSAQAVNEDLSSQTQTTTETTASSEAEVQQKMYVTQYAYLHTKPANDAENIVCMSPGVEVTVLNFEDNGYVKITFQNIDGPLTGYIYKDYLASYGSESETVQQPAQTQAQTEAQYNQQGTEAYTQQNYDNNYTDYNYDDNYQAEQQNNW